MASMPLSPALYKRLRAREKAQIEGTRKIAAYQSPLIKPPTAATNPVTPTKAHQDAGSPLFIAGGLWLARSARVDTSHEMPTTATKPNVHHQPEIIPPTITLVSR
jgi:hypothetical protein